MAPMMQKVALLILAQAYRQAAQELREWNLRERDKTSRDDPLANQWHGGVVDAAAHLAALSDEAEKLAQEKTEEGAAKA